MSARGGVISASARCPLPSGGCHRRRQIVAAAAVILPPCRWEAMDAAAGAPRLVGSSLPPSTTGPALIRGLLDTAAGAGLTVVRAWAHGVSDSYPVMLQGPGDLSEGMLRGLDYFLAEAGARGLKVGRARGGGRGRAREGGGLS